jgi:hypothetical protein
MTNNTTPQPAGERSELLPCPLCGSTNLFLRDIAGWELDCRGCELSLVLADDPSREGLIKRWNTRARASQPATAPNDLTSHDEDDPFEQLKDKRKYALYAKRPDAVSARHR